MEARRPVMAMPFIFVLVLVVAALVACGGRKSPPGASPTPSATSSPPASATTSTGPTAAPTTPAPATSSTAPAGSRIVSSRVSYPWHWPNDSTRPGVVTHTYRVPPVPELIGIGVGDHPNDPGERAFNRMSFTFNTTFPSYHFEYAGKLVADGSGAIIPIDGLGALRIVFHVAQAHSVDGTHSTIMWQPPRHIGYQRMVEYVQAGDYEGYLTYGIGVSWPIPQSNPQIPVRAYEVETVTSTGQHLYVVAIDIDAR